MLIAVSGRSTPAVPQWQARAFFASAEKLLEAERAQLAPWWVVGMGLGIALWLVLAAPAAWVAALLCLTGLVLLGLVIGGRLGRSAAWFHSPSCLASDSSGGEVMTWRHQG